VNDKLSAAIEVLVDQLEQQLLEVSETKKMINALLQRMGQEPMFADTAEQAAGGPVRADQYYGKPLATAAQEYLERRKQACSADEILKGLEQGGFDFDALGWKENRMRSLAMSLAKNTRAFHRLPNGSFGLLSWYDERVFRRRDHDREDGAPEPASGKEPKKASA
jgi:hypothetical protein